MAGGSGPSFARLDFTVRPREGVPTTTIVTYRVLLREGKEADEHTLERTFRSLVPPKCSGGPYLTQEGGVFIVDEPVEPGEPLRGWRPA